MILNYYIYILSNYLFIYLKILEKYKNVYFYIYIFLYIHFHIFLYFIYNIK